MSSARDRRRRTDRRARHAVAVADFEAWLRALPRLEYRWPLGFDALKLANPSLGRPVETSRLLDRLEELASHLDVPLEPWQRAAAAERDALAARLAAVEALVDEWERAQKQNRKALGELARGTSHLLLDTPGPADFRAALAAPTDTTKEN